MCDTAENKELTPQSFPQFLETRVLRDPAQKGSKAYKAVVSLLSYLGEDADKLLTELPTAITDWLISLRIRVLSLSTAFSYLKAISGLHTQAADAGIVEPSPIYSQLKATLRSDETIWTDGLTQTDFQALQRLTKTIATRHSAVAPEGDIILLSLLTGATPIAQIATLKKTDITAPDEAVELLVRRQLAGTTRQYLFPLNQGKTTPEKFLRTLTQRLSTYFAAKGLRWLGDADQTLRSYWAYALLMAGARPHVVAAVMGSAPAGLPLLRCFGDADADAELREALAPAVAQMFTDNPYRWFAMHLRRRVTIGDLQRRLDAVAPHQEIPELYYPLEEISRKIGRRIVFEEKPFIRDIVFFRSRLTDIAPLFFQIGDLAWCITVGGKGTAYAPISAAAFERFQRAVGRFTPDYREAHTADPLLPPGSEVLVIGAPYPDARATIVKVDRNDPDGIVTYLINICNDLTTRFLATVPAHNLRPL